MAPPLAPPQDYEVRLLGRPAMHAAGGWSDLKPGLISALLGYLAFQGRWVDRAELIALFWPDRSEDVARGNLRPLLWRLANEPVAYGLERERSLLRWPVRTDHQAFVEACRAQHWRDAWTLPRGELLSGVRLPAAPEFDTWLEMERATVRSALRTAGMRAADEATRSGDLDEAVDVLGDLYHLDTFDEEVLRALMAALHRRDARSDALELMTRFERLCREELGAEPEPATRALAAKIRAGPVERTPRAPGDARARGAAPRRPATLPVPLTPFVGRRDLVAAVSRTIVDAGCRVLTLVGPGGVGKSRIAIEVAQEVEGRFEEGARFIELAALSSEGALLAAVAGAIGAELAAGEDPRPQVLRALGAHRMLLVLDNAEHLGEVPTLVADLLGQAPGATVLITSRRATGLAGEVLVDVDGLAHLDEPERGRRSRAARGAASRPTEAAELFLQVAHRAGAALPSEALPTIERLCAHLGGVPLAIELAGAWTRVLELDAIETALTRGLDLLSGEAPDRAARHASMRVVFDQSWATLQPRERAAMRCLAPFRGGFTLEAARAVAEVELPVLLALTNKSFLRRAGDGRLTRHPLVWRYVQERAKEHPEELDAARDRHAAYFLEFLAARHEGFHHADGERMMREIDAELANVTVAWRWACERGLLAPLRSAVVSLGRFCWAWGRYDLQDALWPRALEAAGDDPVLMGLLLVHEGSAQTWRAIGDFGAALFEQALSLLEPSAGPAEMAWALRGHGIAQARNGRRDRAAVAYERAAALYRQVGDVEGALMMALSRASEADSVGESLARYDRCVDESRAAGAPHPLAMGLAGRAGMLRSWGDFKAAEDVVREAQHLHRGMRAPFWSLDRRNVRALVCIERGRLRFARALCCRTLAGRGTSASEVEGVGDAATVAMAALARVEYLEGDDLAATTWARRSLEHHRSQHGPAASYDLAASTLVRIALREGDLDDARRWTDELGRGPEPRWYTGPLTTAAATTEADVCRAEVELASGDVAAATVHARSALTRARAEELLAAGLAALVTMARILERRGERDGARRVAAYVHEHPRASFETRREAARLPRVVDGAAPDRSTAGVLDALDRALGDLE